MFIEKCGDPKRWEQFVTANQDSNFLQSYWWGQILKKEGKEVEYWELYGNKKSEIQGIALIQRKEIVKQKFTYLESLWGPIWRPNLSSFEIRDVLEDFCHYVFEKYNDVFWRLSPPPGVLITTSDIESEFSYKFYPSFAKTRPPKKTNFINLEKTEEEILSNMKSKTRYNIKLAGRKNLKVTWSTDQKGLEKFYELIKLTAKRGKFNPHPMNHYRNLLDTKSPGSPAKIEIGLVTYKGKVLATTMILFFNSTAYYLHGASSDEYRNLMAPYLMHWESILRAKKNGCKVYDFWGTDSKMWPGVTKFKEGFGGQEKEYPELYELPIRIYRYGAYRIYGRIRK